MRNKLMLLGIVFGFILAGFLGMTMAAPQDSGAKGGMADIKKKIADLEQRVSDLETIIILAEDDDEEDPKGKKEKK